MHIGDGDEIEKGTLAAALKETEPLPKTPGSSLTPEDRRALALLKSRRDRGLDTI